MKKRKIFDSKVETDLVYDKRKDIAEVSQHGFINLCEAYVNGSIPSDVSADVERYNGIEDPASIMGKPSDIFDAARMRETVTSYKAPSNNEEGV